MTPKSLKNQSFYRGKIIRGVNAFLNDHNIHLKDKRLLIGVSGGADSMFLLWLVTEFKKMSLCGEVVATHINHGVRQESEWEQKVVSQFCDSLNVKLMVTKLSLQPGENFEARARMARQECFQKQMSHFDFLLLGHHLDDSFEWSLLSSFRSSNLKSQIGIPLRNRKIIRPFMCMSRFQIEKWVSYFGIPFVTDNSNFDTKFERNYIRHKLVNEIKNRHPQYLKHYVNSHTELAKKFNLWLGHQSTSIKKYDDLWGGTWLEVDQVRDWEFQSEIIIETILKYSKGNRGSLATEVNKVIKAIQNHKKGPHLFSGEVWAYFFYDRMLIMGHKEKERWQEMDEMYSKDPSNFVREDLIKVQKPDLKDQKKFKDFQIKSPFILLPKFSESLMRRNYRVYSVVRMQHAQKSSQFK